MKSKIIQLKYIVKAALQIMLLSALWGNVKAQINTPPPLNPKLQALARAQSTHGWIDFREGISVNPATIFTDLKDGFELKEGDQMKVNKTENQTYLKNAYRVLLTRARQGMVIYISKGSNEDLTRIPTYYNNIYKFLMQCGLK